MVEKILPKFFLTWQKFLSRQRELQFCETFWKSTKIILSFYARKQLLLSARLSHRNSVCPSVSPWISQKRCKIRSPNLHHRLRGKL